MDRLLFTYPFHIDRHSIGRVIIEHRGITHYFFTFYEKRVFRWEFQYVHDPMVHEYNISCAGFTPLTSNISEPINVEPQDCSCKFILKRANHPDLECTVVGRGDDTYIPRFYIPKEHEIFKFLVSFVETPDESTAVLVFEMELPKAFFILNLPKDLEMAPDGWEKDERYKILTVKDKHDFHIVCKDGVFYTKKWLLKRYVRFFEEKFEDDWKDKHELHLDVSLESMRAVGAYIATGSFVKPKKMDLQALKEMIKVSSEFKLRDDSPYMKALDVFACRELNESTLSLFELVSLWKMGALCHRLQRLIVLIINRKYYTEIMTEYKPDATFLDNEKREMHKMLHDGVPNCICDFEKSLIQKISEFHEMNEKMIVTEVSKKV